MKERIHSTKHSEGQVTHQGGKLASRPHIDMTVAMLRDFGSECVYQVVGAESQRCVVATSAFVPGIREGAQRWVGTVKDGT
jgi:5-enolpyruvylshikimate-3-phosphate synthase